HVNVFGFRQHRRAAKAVIRDEFYGQGILFSAAYYLAFSQLFGSVLLLACTGFSAWSSVNSFCGGVCVRKWGLTPLFSPRHVRVRAR
ncbi:MAG: hypothetical protein J7M40_13925, partial [Planctomycetes bacterium]|nr:hypothetical protein [Planctomycetota bacterium]